MSIDDDNGRTSTYTTSPSLLDKSVTPTAIGHIRSPPRDCLGIHVENLTESGPEETKNAQLVCQLKHYAVEPSFIISMSLTQVLGEYLISGYSVLLPSLLKDFSDVDTSAIWLKSALTLISASMTLPFSRLVDIYGGYCVFFVGGFLVLAWTIICTFAASPAIVILSRAMQGIGVAALQPATFSLISTRYAAGKQRNLVLGICSASAPLGFFVGIATSGLAVTYTTWRIYFYVPAGLSLLSMVLMYISAANRSGPGHRAELQMDWMGAAVMPAGLFSIMYALAAASHLQDGWRSPHFVIALTLGMALLLFAAFVEVRLAACPLLPPDFFRPRSLLAFCLASLFFYATFGVFLFYSPL